MNLLKKVSVIIFSFILLYIIGCKTADIKQHNKNSETLHTPYLIDYNSLKITNQKIQNSEEPILTFGKNLLKEADIWLDSSYSIIVN